MQASIKKHTIRIGFLRNEIQIVQENTSHAQNVRLNANLEIHNSFERFRCISVDHDSENDIILIVDFERYQVESRR